MRRHLTKYFLSTYLPLLVLGFVATRVNGTPFWLGVMAPGIAAAHFVHKQRLEELTLFHRLFSEFNARYDRLNNLLQGVISDPRHLTATDRSALFDYFNLCGEEYFYYSQGLVSQSVWKAWCRGMLEYLDDARVAQLWHEEQLRGSYYGLTREIIASGAKREHRDESETSRARLAA